MIAAKINPEIIDAITSQKDHVGIFGLYLVPSGKDSSVMTLCFFVEEEKAISHTNQAARTHERKPAAIKPIVKT